MELVVEQVLTPGIEGRSTSTPHGLQPITIKLDFVGPFRAFGQPGDGEAIHGLDETSGPSWKGTFLWHDFGRNNPVQLGHGNVR
jgi:hypothetical protein